MKAVRIHTSGDPSVLVYEDVPKPVPQHDEIVVQIHYAGLNYIDTYHRSGLYKVNFPFTLGQDGAGVVESVGEKVKNYKVGDRVAICLRSSGTYAEYAVVKEDNVIPIPEGIDLDVATALMVQGMTAHYLTHSVYEVKMDDTVLVHAASGGTGQYLLQISKLKGAKVIATVGSEEKAKLAKSLGADYTIQYNKEDFEQEVKKITKGEGVNVVYDGVGKATWEKSMNSLKRRGYLVVFGNASGPVPPIDPLLLTRKGSLFLTRPSLIDFIQTKSELNWRANDLFTWYKTGKVKSSIYKVFDLKDATKAHVELQSRRATGKILLRVFNKLVK